MPSDQRPAYENPARNAVGVLITIVAAGALILTGFYVLGLFLAVASGNFLFPDK